MSYLWEESIGYCEKNGNFLLTFRPNPCTEERRAAAEKRVNFMLFFTFGD